MNRPKKEKSRKFGVALLTPVALLASSFLVYQASNAAFTAQTSNGANSWSSGTVVLSDDDAGNVMFNVTGLTPGDSGTKCVNVAYTGNLAATVKLFASPYDDAGGLGQYLDFTVEEGANATGGATMDCTGFTSGASLYTGTLTGFATAHTNYANGASTWAPTGADSKSYKFTYTMQDTNAAQGKSVNATFVWEARNS